MSERSFYESILACQLTDKQRLVRVSTLIEQASELLWKAGVTLRTIHEGDIDDPNSVRGLNYKACILADDTILLASKVLERIDQHD